MDKKEQELLTMNQLAKKINRTRVTIHKYINQGMPVVKKGRNNFFNFNDVREWLSQYYTCDEYVELMSKAQSSYPNDPLKQIKHLDDNASRKTYAIGMVEIAQNLFEYDPEASNYTISFDVGTFDYFFRGVLFALRHVQDEDPFVYISNRVETFITEAIKQRLRFPYKYKKKVFETFFEQTEETMEDFENRELDIENEDYGDFVVDF